MKTNNLLLALALTALVGCTIPKNPVGMTPIPPADSPPPMLMVSPPLPPKPKMAPRKPAFALSSTITKTNAQTMLKRMDYKSSEINLSGEGTNIVVSWPTNMGKYVLIYTTNLAIPRELWTMPKTTGLLVTNADRVEFTFTNNYPQCFFTLVKHPVPDVLLAWNYDFIRSPNAVGFVLYCGPASRSYTNRVDVGMCLWHSMPAPFATNYYTVTAHDGFGLESEYSNEVSYVRPNP